MHRLFVGLSLPEIVSDGLSVLQSGIDGARWRPVENFHITLAFLGETDTRGFENAIDALSQIEPPVFELSLSGIGYFGDQDPRAVWARVEASEALSHLQAKTAQSLRKFGFQLESRKFIPHVTLAYLKGISQVQVEKYCSQHALFKMGPFPVESFHLYSSKLGGEVSHYEIEASYSLSFSR